MDPKDFKEDEKQLRKAIREYETAKYNVEHGAPVYRPENQAKLNEIEPYL